MTRLEIKSLMSSDLDIATWQPESLDDVWFAIEMEIGLIGDDKADLFQTIVATPEGLRKHASEEVISKRGTLVLSRYSPQILRNVLEEILSECSAENWNESVLRLQRYFFWEYEDYVQEDHSS